jgi:carbamoyltransferase
MGGICGTDLDNVVFFEKPFVKFERLLLSSLQTFPRLHRVFREAMITWLGDKLWIKHLIQKRLGIAPSRILFSEHHLSHAASAYFCSAFDAAAVLTVDGVGEWTTASLGLGRGSELRLLKEIRFPHSLGLLRGRTSSPVRAGIQRISASGPGTSTSWRGKTSIMPTSPPASRW